jgi:acyl dehydratase
MVRYYEDIEIGDRLEHGGYTVTKAEIVDFAEQYDPQPFHVDEDAAGESMMGELIASGWHTAAVCMRLFVDRIAETDWEFHVARGIDELRWIRPVRPGDELSIEVEVVDKGPAPDRPGVGEVDTRMTGYRADGDPVISWVGLGMVEQRT